MNEERKKTLAIIILVVVLSVSIYGLWALTHEDTTHDNSSNEAGNGEINHYTFTICHRMFGDYYIVLENGWPSGTHEIPIPDDAFTDGIYYAIVDIYYRGEPYGGYSFSKGNIVNYTISYGQQHSIWKEVHNHRMQFPKSLTAEGLPLTYDFSRAVDKYGRVGHTSETKSVLLANTKNFSYPSKITELPYYSSHDHVLFTLLNKIENWKEYEGQIVQYGDKEFPALLKNKYFWLSLGWKNDTGAINWHYLHHIGGISDVSFPYIEAHSTKEIYVKIELQGCQGQFFDGYAYNFNIYLINYGNPYQNEIVIPIEVIT